MDLIKEQKQKIKDIEPKTIVEAMLLEEIKKLHRHTNKILKEIK